MYWRREDRNLLNETLEDLADNGKAPEDVRWVGVAAESYEAGWWIDWATFVNTACAAIYPRDRGGSHIEPHLVVVGDGWWLERWEFDGAEGWDFKTQPAKPEAEANFVTRRMLISKD